MTNNCSDHTTVQACLQAAQILDSVSDSARLDVELLLCKVLQRERTYLYAWPEHELTAAQQLQFADLLEQRKLGRPIAHLIGEKEFWSLSLQVNDSTLIPRPDTEILVEAVLSLPRLESKKQSVSLLDLGTGTGAIALAVASERPDWQIDAVDKSAAAVTLAQSNASTLQVTNVNIFISDWFAAIEPASSYHVIVSNPPYIDATDLHLEQGDVRFEPSSALVAEQAGYADLFFIIDASRTLLSSQGWLLLEHGFQQGEKVRAKMQELGFVNVTTQRDYGDNERVTLGQYRA